jgi:hypothetical protein
MTILSPSNLETASYNQPEWVFIYNACIDRLNTLLLRFQALQDVSISSLKDGTILVWDATRSKWRVARIKETV